MRGRPSILVCLLAAVGVCLGVLYFVGTYDRTGERYLDTDPAVDGPGAGPTLSTADLTADQRRLFERAIAAEDGRVRLPPSVDATPWIDHGRVRHDDRIYRIRLVVVP